jgi:hypothetical protein
MRVITVQIFIQIQQQLFLLRRLAEQLPLLAVTQSIHLQLMVKHLQFQLAQVVM